MAGCLVSLTTVDDQVYTGILVGDDERTGKLRLKNVSINKIRLPGLQNFFASNIKELELISERPDFNNSDVAPGPHQGKRKVLNEQHHKKDSVRHKDGLVSSRSLELSSYQVGDHENADQGIGSSSEENDSFEDFYEMDNYIMFCRTCEKFRDSIRCLMSQDLIAVAFFGMDISRKGVLSIVQVATEKEIILYDILRLGPEGFLDGLQAVLESQNVIKVIHDCRMVSDALFHQFEVTLSNVFDTQVGAVFAHRLCNGGEWPRFVDNLSSTLITHLGLKENEVHHFFERDRSNQSDDIWLQRPLGSELVQDSLKNLVNMIPLYQMLHTKLLMEYEIGVEMYLNHVRDIPQEKIEKCMSFSHLLPHVFQDLPMHAADAVKRKHFRKARHCLKPEDFMGNGHSPATRSHGRNSTQVKVAKSANDCDGKIATPPKCDFKEQQMWTITQQSKPTSSSNIRSDFSSSLNNVLSESSLSPSPSAELSERLGTIGISEPAAISTKSKLSSLPSPSFKSCTAPSPSELSRRLLPKPETKRLGSDTDVSSGSEGYISSRSILARSALNQFASPSCSSASSVYSESLSEPEIEDFRNEDRGGCWNENDWDADRLMEMEMTQSILRQARQERSSKTDIRKHLLPSKLKVKSPPKPSRESL